MLNRPTLTVTLSSPLEGVIRVRIEHHSGGAWHGGFELPGAVAGGAGAASVDGRRRACSTTGPLVARIAPGAPWDLSFEVDGARVTGSGQKSQGVPAGRGRRAGRRTASSATRASGTAAPARGPYVHEQLDLGVGELVYGLGERFGPLVKNGQTVDIWNADGGTSSEQAYKNVPFYLSEPRVRRARERPGARVVRDRARRPSSGCSSRSPGESLEYFVIAGPHAEGGARALHRAHRPPAGRAGLVVRPVAVDVVHDRLRRGHRHLVRRRDGPPRAARLGLPLRLLLDARVQLVRLRVGPAGVPRPRAACSPACTRRTCGSASGSTPTSASARRCSPRRAAAGYLVKRPDGSVVAVGPLAGRAWASSTSPTPMRPPGSRASCARCVDQGVDCFKTDFGERIPLEVDYFDGSRPDAHAQPLHAAATTRPCSTCSTRRAGAGDAVLFARSATTGGQSMPVHWGGDSTSTFESMAETLRGGLSLAPERLRVLEPRHRRLRGHAGRRGLQALDRVRAARHRTAASTARAPTGCRGPSTRRPSTSRASSRS